MSIAQAEHPVAARYTYRGEDVYAFAIETYADVIGDIEPLLHEHWLELAAYPDIPLDPDYAFYERANKMDFLRIYTARKNGELIGYALFTIVRRHPHYATSFAVSDIILVKQEHRNYKVGSGLFDLFERDLEGFVVSISTKNAHPELQMLAASRGYEPISTDYAKRF